MTTNIYYFMWDSSVPIPKDGLHRIELEDGTHVVLDFSKVTQIHPTTPQKPIPEGSKPIATHIVVSDHNPIPVTEYWIRKRKELNDQIEKFLIEENLQSLYAVSKELSELAVDILIHIDELSSPVPPEPRTRV